jgi:hypothetical protein
MIPCIYHSEHHQRIIPAKGLDEPESDKASQANRNKRNSQKDGSDDKDRFAATLQWLHRDSQLMS